MNTFDLLIPCATGIEAVVKRQLDALSYPDAKAYNGRIRLTNMSWQDVALLNVFLRSGERVFLNVAHFDCPDFDALYDNIKQFDWHQLLQKDSKFTVITKSVHSKLFAHNAIQSVAKKAIADKLYSHYGTTLDESGSEFVIEVALLDDIADINIDTSGAGLHKRGYRTLPYSAPLKETTAAALIDLSYYNADKTFADAFCGSGTLPIECCLKALNIAPGLSRDFLFRHWQCCPDNAYKYAIERAKDVQKVRKLDIVASDIDSQAVELAKFHARQAGVEQYIRFAVGDARNFYCPSSYGVLISNPPYGERLGDIQQVQQIAKDMGKVYKKLDNWNFYFLSPFQGFERCFGRRADKKRKLYNAGIECSYYSFCGAKPPRTATKDLPDSK